MSLFVRRRTVTHGDVSPLCTQNCNGRAARPGVDVGLGFRSRVGGEKRTMRLRYVDPSVPGYSRRRRGRGFEYLDTERRRVDDEQTLARIRGLVLPPAWDDVWICPWPNGHIQAVGRDSDGRRQYVYHEEWRAERDRQKFSRMLDFGRALPGLRAQVVRDLARRGLVSGRVLACSMRLLDRGFFRIGGEEYAGENGTFGLATLRREHAQLENGGAIRFSYLSKGGKLRELRLVDPDVRAVIQSLKRRRGGPELLAYRNGRGWKDVRSDDINDYLREHAGKAFSAKDFRTWHATVLAAVSVDVLGRRAHTDTARRRVVSQATKEVSRYLGNTASVCRDSYIDPRVFECFYDGKTIGLDLDTLAEPRLEDELLAAEEGVLDLLV
jgi:DNA topoisomerase I